MRDPSVVMMKDTVPLLRAGRTHFVTDQGRWRRLIRVAPVLRVNLARQEVEAARLESLWAIRQRATTRLARTVGGNSLWCMDVACGRPVKHLMTRAQAEITSSLTLCKHQVRFYSHTKVLPAEGKEEESEEGGDGSEEAKEEGIEESEQMVVGDCDVDSQMDLFSELDQPIGE